MLQDSLTNLAFSETRPTSLCTPACSFHLQFFLTTLCACLFYHCAYFISNWYFLTFVSFKRGCLTRWRPWSFTNRTVCHTVTILANIDQLFCRCVFIYSNFHWELVASLHNGFSALFLLVSCVKWDNKSLSFRKECNQHLQLHYAKFSWSSCRKAFCSNVDSRR